MSDTPPQSLAAGRLDPAFLALLCCPVCDERPALQYRAADGVAEEALLCRKCGREYPIIEGLPDLRPRNGGGSDALAPAAA